MRDYSVAASGFDYAQVASATLQGSLEALNACVECCDRHVGSNKIALNWEGRDGEQAQFSFEQLQQQAARFANVLRAQGVGPGDRVAGLLPRIPELLVTILASWRLGAVYQPLFTAFGPKAIEHRLHQSDARVVITDAGNRSKLDEVVACPTIISIGAQSGSDDVDFRQALNAAADQCEPVLLDGDAPFLMMFTSGTTGPAKPLMVPLRAIVAFQGYMRDAIDL
ncbi:MAG: AMP-binding protein, partial [Pseudomonas sp.]